MKVYLINLDRDAERLAHMRKQLNGVAFQRISAVDGLNDPPTTKGLSRFELACLESHKLAWRQFLNGAEGHACFLEDDLHVWPGFAKGVGDIHQRVLGGRDTMHLPHNRESVIRTRPCA